MHHKRKRHKAKRAGCAMCKPNKQSGFSKDKLGHYGFGKIRDVIHAREDQRTYP